MKLSSPSSSMRHAWRWCGRHTRSALVFILAVTPLSDFALRLSTAESSATMADNAKPYEAPALKVLGAFFAKDAAAAPPPLSP